MLLSAMIRVSLLTLPLLAFPGVLEAQTLQHELDRLDGLRNGAETPFDQVDILGKELLLRYPTASDQAEIYFQLAHVYAQSGLHRPDLISRYARMALKDLADPNKRAYLYSYLGSAAEVDRMVPEFEARRRTAATANLEGLREIIQLGLPTSVRDPAPLLMKDIPDVESTEGKQYRKDYQDAYRQHRIAQFQREMLNHREIFIRQVVRLYGSKPFAQSEVKSLADSILRNAEEVASLMSKIEARMESETKRLAKPDSPSAPVPPSTSTTSSSETRITVTVVSLLLLAFFTGYVWRRDSKQKPVASTR